MEPIYIFTFTGVFAMGATLSARQVSHDVLTYNQQAFEFWQNTKLQEKQLSKQVSKQFLGKQTILFMIV